MVASAELDPPEVKGSLVRALAGVVAARKLTQAVMARVSAPAGALLVDPPLATMWVDARLTNEVYQALYEVAGPDELRDLNREAIARGVAPLLRAAVEHVLGVFGTSPATIFARFSTLSRTTSRGVVYAYEPLGSTSGRFEVEFPTMTDVPMGPFVATTGGLALIFELCHTWGNVTGLEPVPNGRGNRMRFTVAWRSTRSDAPRR
jgi:hypothetical protein